MVSESKDTCSTTSSKTTAIAAAITSTIIVIDTESMICVIPGGTFLDWGMFP
jgi:hypothetical protein